MASNLVGSPPHVLLSAIRRDTKAIYALMLYWDHAQRIELWVDWIGLARLHHRVYADCDRLCSEVQRIQARNTLGKQLISHAAKTIPGAKDVLNELYTSLAATGSPSWLSTKPAIYLGCCAAVKPIDTNPYCIDKCNERVCAYPSNNLTSSVGRWYGEIHASGFHPTVLIESRYVARDKAAQAGWVARNALDVPQWAKQAVQQYGDFWSQLGLLSPDAAGVTAPPFENLPPPTAKLPPTVVQTVEAAKMLKGYTPSVIFPEWAEGLPFQMVKFTLEGPRDHPTFQLLPSFNAPVAENRLLSSVDSQFGGNRWSVVCDRSSIIVNTKVMTQKYRAWQPFAPPEILAAMVVGGGAKVKTSKGGKHLYYEVDAGIAAAKAEASIIARAWASGMHRLIGKHVRLDALGSSAYLKLIDLGVLDDKPSGFRAYATFDATAHLATEKVAADMATLASESSVAQAIEQLKTAKRGRRIILED